MVNVQEWSKLTRVQGEAGGCHAYLKGESIVRMCLAANIPVDAKNLEMKIESVYGKSKQGWLVIIVRQCKGD
jgi:hypothetical protein